MTLNSLYPGFIRLEYQTPGGKHIQVIPCMPVLDAGAWKLTPKSGALIAHATAIATYVALLQPVTANLTTFISSQIWTLLTPTSDPVFVEENIINLAGTDATAYTPLLQNVVTFRTLVGGLYRHYWLEGTDLTPNLVFKGPNFANAAWLAIINYIKGDTGFFRGRDGGVIIGAIRQVTKTNDAIRTRRLLNA